MHALIDGDPIVYMIGFHPNNNSPQKAYQGADFYIRHILRKSGAKQGYSLYLTDTDITTNFRWQIYPEYKQNRKDSKKPEYYRLIRTHLINKWGAHVVSGIEADDAVAIYHVNKDKTIVCSPDKDLNQLEGSHYDYKSDKHFYIDSHEACLNLYRQALMGDISDNIPGIKGIGKVKSRNILESLLSPREMYDKVLEVYLENGQDEPTLLRNLKLLYLLRSWEDEYVRPE